MSALETVLSHGLAARVGWTLVHFVWQAAAVAILAAVILRALRKAGANVRYVVACAALGLMALLPFVTIHLVEAPGPAAEARPAPVSVDDALPTPVEIVTVDQMPEPSARPPLETADLTVPTPWQQRVAAALEPALPYLVLGWLLGVFGLSAWHLGGWAQLQRLKRRLVNEVGDPLRGRLKDLAGRLGVRRAVTLLESALVEVPTVVGWLRPVILLPASALTGLSPEQLEALLAHELAHIRRCDYLVNIVQTIVEILGFFHPAVWWVSHRIRAERENCCDDLAVSVCGDSVGYARALTSLEELRHRRAELAVAASGGHLLGRVARLLGRPAVDDRRFAWLPGLITLIVVTLIVIPTALVLAAPERPEGDPLTVEDPTADESIQEAKQTITVDLEFVKVSTDRSLTPEAAARLSTLWNQSSAERKTGHTWRAEELQLPATTLLERCAENGHGDADALETLVDLLVSLEYARVLMNPRVETSDGQQAQIQSKQHVPDPTAEPEGSETVECTDVMTVTPRVDDAGYITLDIVAEISDVVVSDSAGGAPRITKSAIDTRAVLDEDEALVVHLESATEGEAPVSDALYLLVHPRIREPESPSGPPVLAMVPAQSQDDGQEHDETLIFIDCILARTLAATLDRETRLLLRDILAADEAWARDHLAGFDAQQDMALGAILRAHIVGKLLAPSTIDALVELLRTRGYLRVEASPHVLTPSGKQAQVAVTTDERFLVGENPAASPRQIKLGTIVQTTPHLASPTSDRITLEIAVKWTELAEEPQAGDLPTVRTTEMASTVTVPKDRFFVLLMEPDHAEDAVASEAESMLVMFRADAFDPLAAEEKASSPQAEQSDAQPRQVLLDVRTIVVERDNLANLGVEWSSPHIRTGPFAPPSGPDERSERPLPFGLQVGYSPDEAFTDALLTSLGRLCTQGQARVLARQQVVALDGRTARVRAITEEWFTVVPPHATADHLEPGTELVNITSGTVLDATPRIGDNNEINLALTTKVSRSIPRERAGELPIVSRRQARNVVTVKDGGTVALAGLTEHKGDSEREIAILVTARLVREDGQLPQTGPVALVLAEPEPPVPATLTGEEPPNSTSAQPPTEKPGESEYTVRVDVTILEVLSDAPLDAETAAEVRQLLGGKDATSASDPTTKTTLGKLLQDAGGLELTDVQADTLVSLLGSRGYARMLGRPTMEMRDGQTGRIFAGQHTPEPNEPADAPRDGLTLNVIPEARPQRDATQLQVDLELKRTLPPGPGDDQPDTQATTIATTVMARNGHHILIPDHAREPFVDEAGEARMILLLVKPTLIPVEPRDSATEAPRSPLEPAEAATARVVMPPVDAVDAAEDEGLQVLLEFIFSQVQSNVTLDRNMAEDIRSLLWEIYATQPEGPGRPVYVPSVKKLQRPLSEVLDEYFIKPKLSGPGLKMLTDMLNVRRLARTLTSPRMLTRVGRPIGLATGEWHDPEVVGNAVTPGPLNFKLEVTPTLSDDPSVLSLDTTLQLKDVIVEDERRRFEAESMSLRATSTAPDGEYHLCVGSGFERRDEEGHPCTLLVLAKATLMPGDPPAGATGLRKKALEPGEAAHRRPNAAAQAARDEIRSVPSRAWSIMRYPNCPPLLLGLTPQFAKVMDPARPNDAPWRPFSEGGSLIVKIDVEEDLPGEIVLGLFKEATWLNAPVAVRRLPGPGEHRIDGLPSGTYQIGAMVGTPPVPDALGVHADWPAPVTIESGGKAHAAVLVSPAFQKWATGASNERIARDHCGQCDEMDRNHLIKGRLTGPDGEPIRFGEVLIREHKEEPRRGGIAAPNIGTDEEGRFKFDEARWPYRVVARWHDPLPSAFGCRTQDVFYNRVLEGPHTFDLRFKPFPEGTARVEGRVIDQDGAPVKGFFVWVRTQSDDESEIWRDPDGQRHITYAYKVPFLSEDGRFELSGLPAGKVTVDPVPFETRRYQSEWGDDVTLEAGRTTTLDFELESKHVRYGRVLFEDGTAATITPPPWKGAVTRVLMTAGSRARGIAEVDAGGYFAAYLDDGELDALAAGQTQLMINVPKDTERKWETVGRFPFDGLAERRSQAGQIRVKRPALTPALPPDRRIGRPLPASWKLEFSEVPGPSQAPMKRGVLLVVRFAAERPKGEPGTNGEGRIVLYTMTGSEVDSITMRPNGAALVNLRDTGRYLLVCESHAHDDPTAAVTQQGPFLLDLGRPGRYTLTQVPAGTAEGDVLRPRPDLKNYLVDAYVARVQARRTLDPNTAAEVAHLIRRSGAPDSTSPPTSSLTDPQTVTTYTVGGLLHKAGENVPGELFRAIVRSLAAKGYMHLEAHPHMAARDGLPNELNVVHDELTSPGPEKTAVRCVRLAVTCHAIEDDDSARLDIEFELTEPTPSGDVSRRAIQTTAVLPNDRYVVIPVWDKEPDKRAIYLMIRQRQQEQSKTAPTPRPVTIDRGTDLLEALARISEGTATPITADTQVATLPVTVDWAGTSAEAALTTILSDTPYTYVEINDRYWVYRRISKVFRGLELRLALAEIRQATGIPIGVGPLVEGGVWVALEDVPIESALEILLAGMPFVARRVGDGYQVTHRSTLLSVRDARIAELAKRIAQIEADLIADQQKLAPNNPTVVQKKQLLAAYEKQLAEKR